MGPKCFWRQNFSLFIVKFKKLGFSAPLSKQYEVFVCSRAAGSYSCTNVCAEA